MNIVVFVPVGVLAGSFFRRMTWMRAIMYGAGLSVGIEALQFVFGKGLTEVDDVIHNTIGCLIGYGLFLFISERIKRIVLIFSKRNEPLG